MRVIWVGAFGSVECSVVTATVITATVGYGRFNSSIFGRFCAGVAATSAPASIVTPVPIGIAIRRVRSNYNPSQRLVRLLAAASTSPGPVNVEA